MDQIRKFGEQTSRILEFKPEGLESQYDIKFFLLNSFQVQTNPQRKRRKTMQGRLRHKIKGWWQILNLPFMDQQQIMRYKQLGSILITNILNCKVVISMGAWQSNSIPTMETLVLYTFNSLQPSCSTIFGPSITLSTRNSKILTRSLQQLK